MKSIRDSVDLMKALYLENDYPSERLIRDTQALLAFTREFNRRSAENYSTSEVAAELERIRKDKAHTGGLPKLGRSFSGPHFTDDAALELV